MKLVSTHLMGAMVCLITACSAPQTSNVTDGQVTDNEPKPPIAAVKPQTTQIHGETRVDNYFWLRERENPDVIQYLEDENAYTEAKMAHTKAAQEKLFEEMVSRIKETDLSAPYRDGDYWYYSKTIEGLNYEIHCRKKGSLDAPEEVLIDENKMAEGKDYFALGSLEVSPNGQFMAYSVDYLGNERYTLKVRDLNTGKDLADSIPETYYSVEWANDNKTLFYNRVDEANRPHQLLKHTVGTDPATDALIYQEDDDRYFLGVQKSRSDAYLMLTLKSAITTEVHVLNADTPDAAFTLVEPRKQAVEYYLDHHGERFFIMTNDDGATNFKLLEAPVGAPGKANWKTVIPHNEEVTLKGLDAFKDHLVIEERRRGLPTIRVRNLNTNEEHQIQMPEPTYAAGTRANYEFNTSMVRFNYTSLVSPRSVYDYDMNTKALKLVKQTEVFHYDATKFESKRIYAKAADGTEVPISLVYQKGALDNGPTYLHLTGYGSYGASYDPYFSSARVSLLERGVVFGIAHIRGGGEKGRMWYENGKMQHKMNTFNDFIACAEHLIAEGMTSPDKLGIEGGSAGGLLMGAVVNMRPELFTAVIASVPFVDVVNTMLDESIPLTATEWEEWGNPQKLEDYNYIKQYSPYDNVAAQDYPDMLITAGLNDPRVQYWEPAKWTAKLRATKTDGNLLLLKTNMGAGHGGASGRYDYLKEVAFEHAFLLDQFGLLN